MPRSFRLTSWSTPASDPRALLVLIPVRSALEQVCARAVKAGRLDQEAARQFFETNFLPVRIRKLGDPARFLTGYYEPIVERRLEFGAEIPAMAGPNTGNFVAYYRVSTQRQGRSGLGLDAQQKAVRDHLNGGDWRIVTEFTEVESGTRPGRPKLAQALKTCRALGATLIIAKLDRLARNVHFVSGLMESGVEFTAVDFPQANRLTVHILAAVAEHEAKMISERTKVALAAAKRRGVKLGGDRGARLTAKARRAGTEAVQARANERAADLAPIVAELQANGARSLRAIAAGLNERGIRTPAASASGRPVRWRSCWRGCRREGIVGLARCSANRHRCGAMGQGDIGARLRARCRCLPAARCLVLAQWVFGPEAVVPSAERKEATPSPAGAETQKAQKFMDMPR